jgi:hypothetical protein
MAVNWWDNFGFWFGYGKEFWGVMAAATAVTIMTILDGYEVCLAGHICFLHK